MKGANQEFPLAWPESWPRTTGTKASQFKTTLPRAIANVQAELVRFGKDSGIAVENIVISSNYSLTTQNPKDAGVAVYFGWDGLQTCIAVDRYPKIEDNLQAIFLCIEAERTKMRHGGLNLVRAAFRGYAALPPPSAANRGRHWSAVLEVDASASLEKIATARNKLAQKFHPDKPGGSAEKMAEINAAYESAKREKGE